MADSEWESIRKKFKNRLLYSIGISIPVLLLGGFFFYNNWDIINTNATNEERKKFDTDEMQQSDTFSVSITKNTDTSDIMRDSVEVLLLQSDTVLTAGSKIKRVEMDEDLGPHSEEKTVFKEEASSSLTLTSIKCRSSDRNELLLLLSVKLLSDVPVLQRRILAMREEFKVIIQKIIRSREFCTLNKELLRSEMIKSVNEYIGKDVFNDLKFTEFKIEKVTKK